METTPTTKTKKTLKRDVPSLWYDFTYNCLYIYNPEKPNDYLHAYKDEWIEAPISMPFELYQKALNDTEFGLEFVDYL